jgi:hypothetical protein
MGGPPIGTPWPVDVGQNPNIARDEPPPPLYDGFPPHMISINPPRVAVPPPTISAPAIPAIPRFYGPPPPPMMFGNSAAATAYGFTAPGFAWNSGACIPPRAFGGMPGLGFDGFGFGGAPVGPEFFGAVPEAQTDPSQFPGGHVPGVTVVESDAHTIIGWVKSPVEPWVLPPGTPVDVEWIHVDSHWSVDRLIKALRGREADLPGWNVTEVREDRATGMWAQGSSYSYGFGPSQNCSLADVNWDKSRNRVGGCSLHVYLHRS